VLVSCQHRGHIVVGKGAVTKVPRSGFGIVFRVVEGRADTGILDTQQNFHEANKHRAGIQQKGKS
jgi:hypothetical protein